MAPPQQLELVTPLAETGGDGRAPGQPGGVGATVSLLTGDCLEQMRLLPDASVDCITTDPPYGLSKEPDAAEVLRHWLAGDDYIHRGGGFMGKSWDSFVPGPAVWREAYRVLKPGGHLLAFFGTRTYQLGALAVQLAGFEIRDMIQWNHGTGYPKSLKVSKVLRESDACCTCDRQDVSAGGLAGGDASEGSLHWPLCGACGKSIIPDGLGTALKPAQEPILVARKPLTGTVTRNVLEHGTGALNIDACRIAVEDAAYARNHSGDRGHAGTRASDQEGATNLHAGGGSASEHGRFPANVILDEFAAQAIDTMHGTTTRSKASAPVGSAITEAATAMWATAPAATATLAAPPATSTSSSLRRGSGTPGSLSSFRALARPGSVGSRTSPAVLPRALRTGTTPSSRSR
jgi:hypothetical protein